MNKNHGFYHYIKLIIINCISYMNKELQYLFNVTCPFSHRGWITLLEKDCDFEPRPVSLKDKEPFFT